MQSYIIIGFKDFFEEGVACWAKLLYKINGQFSQKLFFLGQMGFLG